MTQQNDGGPAFPCTSPISRSGMSLRDWFAGQALIGATAACATDGYVQALRTRARDLGIETDQYIAMSAFAVADAMLAERAKRGGQS